MASRKPIVLVNGQMQQLQSGDTLEVPKSETSLVEMTNGESVDALTVGHAVYVSGAGEVKIADNSASGTKAVLGLAEETISASSSGSIVTNGVKALTTAEWDAVTGETGGLTAGSRYYLSIAGGLTSIPPTATGDYVVAVGVAMSTTEMKIEPEQSILL